MMNACKEASKLASDSLDRQLSAWEKIKLRLHLAMCSRCQSCADSMKLIRSTIRLIDETKSGRIKLSNEQRAKIQHALEKSTDC